MAVRTTASVSDTGKCSTAISWKRVGRVYRATPVRWLITRGVNTDSTPGLDSWGEANWILVLVNQQTQGKGPLCMYVFSYKKSQKRFTFTNNEHLYLDKKHVIFVSDLLRVTDSIFWSCWRSGKLNPQVQGLYHSQGKILPLNML